MVSQNLLYETDLAQQSISNYNSDCFVVITGITLIVVKVPDLICDTDLSKALSVYRCDFRFTCFGRL